VRLSEGFLLIALTPDILNQGCQSVGEGCETTLQVLSAALERRDLVVMLICEAIQNAGTVQGFGEICTLLSIENSHGSRQAPKQAEGKESLYVYIYGERSHRERRKSYEQKSFGKAHRA